MRDKWWWVYWVLPAVGAGTVAGYSAVFPEQASTLPAVQKAVFGVILTFVAIMSVKSTATSGEELRRLKAQQLELIHSAAHKTTSPQLPATPTPSRREQLVQELRGGAERDEILARRALGIIPLVVITGAVLSNLLDDHSATANQIEAAYSLVKRLGTLGVTFYLAHAAVSQYRYSTLRAAHYRACAQAVSACENDATILKVYRMLAPPHAFGASPTSPVDALVKIAGGKDDK